MKHTKWKEYVEGVGNGSIVAGRLIRLAVKRFNSFMDREDMYFDEDEVDRAVDFISIIKHFLGKSAGKNFILEPWQEWFIAFILGFKWKDTGYRVVRNVYFQVARKALDVSTPVLTTTGWTTMGDIQVGDYVYDAEGKPTQVVYTTPVFKGDCYDITFDDGETIRADAGHEWTARHQFRRSKGYTTMTTEEIYQKWYNDRSNGYREYLVRIPTTKPIYYPESNDMDIDYYALGLWLGDGTTGKPQFTTSREDIVLYDRLVERYGQYKTYKCPQHNDTYQINFTNKRGQGKSKLRIDLEKAGVFQDKHIPDFVFTSSITARTEFLRGMFDTDGYVDKTGRIEITQRRKQISDGLAYIIHSLGYKAKITEKIVSGNTYYRVTTNGDADNPLFYSERRIKRLKKPKKDIKSRTIMNMVKAPSTMVRCITVDDDKHQFLCGKSLIVNNNCGKDSLAAAIALYMLIVDGEASPEIACLANSREQARILFKYITQYAKSIDGKGKILKEYRNYITMPSNNGEVKVFSADASKLDGLNVSCGIIDEYHEAKSRALYDVIASSMLQRTQPLMIVITTAGFDLQSPCHDMYMLGVEILEGIKDDDTFLPVIFQLDEDDDWKDMDNTEVWKKCQPNLGVTVTVDAMRAEVKKALNDSTAINGVLTKTFNKWVSSSLSWIPSEIVAKCMGRRVDLNDYAGQYAVIGMDCGSVSDFTSFSVCIPQPMTNEYVFKSWTFIPNATYENSPRKELYKKFVDEGSMIITDGNVCDYDYIQRKIGEIGNVLMIDAIYSDAWNATSLLTSLQDSGYNVLPFSQAIGNFNAPTKEMERLIRESRAIIDKSQNVLWQFGNVELKVDSNGNAKPNKGVGKGSNEAYAKKIDSVISMCTALGGLLKTGYSNDLTIDVF